MNKRVHPQGVDGARDPTVVAQRGRGWKGAAGAGGAMGGVGVGQVGLRSVLRRQRCLAWQSSPETL